MRRRLALLFFVLIAVASIDLDLFRNALHPPADTFQSDEYETFLAGVRQHTEGGDSIALLLPTQSWDNGYAYAFYRASYVLSGREVLPVIGPGDSLHVENVRNASHVAVWRIRTQGQERPTICGRGGAELLGRP